MHRHLAQTSVAYRAKQPMAVDAGGRSSDTRRGLMVGPKTTFPLFLSRNPAFLAKRLFGRRTSLPRAAVGTPGWGGKFVRLLAGGGGSRGRFSSIRFAIALEKSYWDVLERQKVSRIFTV